MVWGLDLYPDTPLHVSARPWHLMVLGSGLSPGTALHLGVWLGILEHIIASARFARWRPCVFGAKTLLLFAWCYICLVLHFRDWRSLIICLECRDCLEWGWTALGFACLDHLLICLESCAWSDTLAKNTILWLEKS